MLAAFSGVEVCEKGKEIVLTVGSRQATHSGNKDHPGLLRMS